MQIQPPSITSTSTAATQWGQSSDQLLTFQLRINNLQLESPFGPLVIRCGSAAASLPVIYRFPPPLDLKSKPPLLGYYAAPLTLVP